MSSETKPKAKAKNKNKNVNKVKIFLANPSKPQSPSLDDESLQEMKLLLTDVINNSNQSPRAFATTAHICLGLESSLRAINSQKASCILLSTSIKPRYLLGLITRNAEVKDETVPTYAQPNLEDFSHTVFGVRSLAIVFPKETTKLGVELSKWIEAHRKPKRIKSTHQSQQIKSKSKRKVLKSNQLPCKELQTLAVTSKTVEESSVMKPWGSSYISFSSTVTSMDLDKANSEEDDKNLTCVLKEMSKRVKEQIEEQEDTMIAESNAKKQSDISTIKESKSDEDDFLETYAPLTVHKIRPNPDRKPRKKNKKPGNKQKNIK